MHAEALRRGASFWVAIVPDRREAKTQSYFASVADYVRRLRQVGIEPIEMLASLTGSDYWTNDPHLNREGAMKR